MEKGMPRWQEKHRHFPAAEKIDHPRWTIGKPSVSKRPKKPSAMSSING